MFLFVHVLYLFTSLLIPTLTNGLPTPTPNLGDNDFTCRSASHPNPVLFLHGLGATAYEDLNVLSAHLRTLSYCTFSLTYGAHPLLPFVGGLEPIADSAVEIAEYIRRIHTTYADPGMRIDLVGHSEGAFQALYIPKFVPGIAPLIDNIVSIAPPTHGTSFAGLYSLASILGNISEDLVVGILNTVGCEACADLVTDGEAIEKLNDGTPIKQAENSITIIASRHDELVTPVETAFVHEDGVRNLFVQDFCPNDPVGHIDEAYDMNVWNLVINALDDTPEREFDCVVGIPGK